MSRFKKLVSSFACFTMVAQPMLAQAVTYSYHTPIREVKSGAAGGGKLSFSETHIDFGTVESPNKATRTIDVLNTGKASISISKIETEGQAFAQSSTCGSYLAPNASCQITVQFSPAAAGIIEGALKVHSNDKPAMRTIELSGRGKGGSLMASTYLFPEPKQTGSELVYHDIPVRNVGSMPVTISGVSLVYEEEKSFSQTNDCLRTLAVSETCTVRVGFAPNAEGTLSNKVAVVSNADNSPLLFEITGIGRNPSGGLEAPIFEKVQVGESVLGTATLKNNGVGSLTIDSITVTGAGFQKAAADNTCGKTLTAGESCSFKVQFTPSQVDTQAGEVLAQTSAGEIRAALAGLAQAPGGTLSDVDFGDIDAGTATIKTAVLKNTGIGPLTVTAPTADSVKGEGFTYVATTCGEAVPVNGSCSVSVRYSPLASSTGAGQLTLKTGAGTLTSNLSGRGQQAILTLSPTTLPDFGSVQAGQAATSAIVTLKNAGNAPASNLVLKTSAGFAVADSTCGTSLATGATCTFKARFVPTGAQVYKGTLNVQADAPAVAVEAALNGTGISQAATLGGVSFGSRVVGVAAEMNATLANTGSGPLSITVPTASSVTGAGFSFVSTDCTGSLAANAACSVRVRFTAAKADIYEGQLAIDTGAGVKQAALTGQGLQGEASVSTGLVTFPDTQVDSLSNIIPVTLTNSGSSDLNVSAISVVEGTDEFKQNNNCAVIPAGHVCTISVQFKPSQAKAQSGVLAIVHDGSGISYVNLTGTGKPQSASLSTPSFAETAKGTTALASAKLTNTGIGPLSVAELTSSAVTGTDFSYSTSTCGSSLAVGASCDITVAFTPSAATTRTGSLNVNTGAGTKTASLTATAVQGFAALTPTSLSFSTQQQGTASAKSITLKNTGSAVLHVTGVQSQGTAATDYMASTSCANVAPEATCSISVTFTPTAAGTRDASIRVIHDGAGATSFDVSGAGQAPSASLAAPAFTGTPVGSSSTANAVLTNTGIGTLSVTVPTAANVTGAGFAFVSTTCPSSLASGDSCSVTVRYTAASTAVANGNLSIVTGAGTQSTGLSGQGIQGTASFTPNALTFTSQQTGTSSAAKTVQLKNTGTHTLVVSNVVVTQGDTHFSRTHDCSSLAVGESCSINVTFNPTVSGPVDGAVTVSHNGNGSSSISLSGQAQAPSASLSTPTFAATPVGSSSTATATLTNTGIAPITVTAPTAATAVTGEGFSFVSTTCGGALAPTASCQVVVQFAPNSTAPRTGTLSVNTSAGLKAVSLGSTAIQGYASISPGSLSFAKTQLYKSAPVQRITVTNTGTNTLSFVGIGVSINEADFQQDNSCKSVPVGGTCAIDVQFTPSVEGVRSGTVSLVHDGGGIAHVSLTGEGQAASATLSTPSFAATAVGSSSNATATLTNTGLDSISVTAPTAANVTGTGFSFVSTNCPATLAANGACQVTLKFTPTSSTTHTGTFIVNTGAGTKSVSLAGSGLQGKLSLNQSPLSFGSSSVNVSSAPQTLTITNTGTATLTVSGISVVEGDSDFGKSPGCATPLAVGQSCSVSVMFTPAATGPRAGKLAIAHNGDNANNLGVTLVDLTGSGVAQPKITKAVFTQTAATAGNNIGFTWATADATTATASCSGAFTSNSHTSIGTTLWVSASNPGTGVCTVVASNSLGAQVSQTVEINVVAKPEIVAQYSAGSAVAGKNVTFSWTATGAVSASVTCSDALSGTSASQTSGALTMVPSKAGTGDCMVIAQNEYGGSAQFQLAITVYAASSMNGRFATTERTNTGYVTVGRTFTFYPTTMNVMNATTTCTSPSGSVTVDASTNVSSTTSFTTTGIGKCTINGLDLSGQPVSRDFFVEVVPSATATATFLSSTIPTNGSTYLRWSTTNATTASVTCTPGLGNASSTALSNSSPGMLVTHQPTLGTTTSCTVAPKNLAGYGTSRIVTLTIEPPPTITAFTAASAQVSQGQTNTLNWTASGSVNTHSITCSGASDYVKPTTAFASNAVVSTARGGVASCTLTLNGPGGSTSATTTFDVVALPVITGGFSPSVIEAGQSATFTWNAAGATDSYLSSCSDFGQNTAFRGASGSFTASTTTSMSGTYSCTVNAKNSLGTYVSQTYQLEVNGPPIIDTWGRDVPSVQWGQTVTVSWSVRKANSVSVACTAGATTVASGSGLTGSLQVLVKNPVQCTLTAVGTKGQVVSAYPENLSAMTPLIQTSFSGFPSTPINSTSTGTVTLTSKHAYPIPMTVPSASSLSAYSGAAGTITFVSTTCTSTLAANGSCTVTLRFAPKSVDYFGTNVNFVTEATTKVQNATGMPPY